MFIATTQKIEIRIIRELVHGSYCDKDEGRKSLFLICPFLISYNIFNVFTKNSEHGFQLSCEIKK